MNSNLIYLYKIIEILNAKLNITCGRNKTSLSKCKLMWIDFLPAFHPIPGSLPRNIVDLLNLNRPIPHLHSYSRRIRANSHNTRIIRKQTPTGNPENLVQ